MARPTRPVNVHPVCVHLPPDSGLDSVPDAERLTDQGVPRGETPAGTLPLRRDSIGPPTAGSVVDPQPGNRRPKRTDDAIVHSIRGSLFSGDVACGSC
jgi:hypothetical protein